MQRPDWAPAGVDIERPGVARMAQANRAFPRRAVDPITMAHDDRAVAVLVVAVLHVVPDSADPAGLPRTPRSALAPGSCLALSAERPVFLGGVGRLGG